MIEVKNLTQVYKSGKGVFDLNFSIKEGEVFGYLGPNGAGKTLLLEICWALPTQLKEVLQSMELIVEKKPQNFKIT